MTQQERFLLMKYDLKLLENVERMVEHIGKVYDFFPQNRLKNGGGTWIKLHQVN